MDQQPPSGALGSFREISDFIPVVSSTAPHLTMTYVLIRGASPSVLQSKQSCEADKPQETERKKKRKKYNSSFTITERLEMGHRQKWDIQSTSIYH